MNKFFLFVVLVVMFGNGCATHYYHSEGWRVTDNYEPGSSHYQYVSPGRTDTYHMGSDTHGR